MLYDPAGFEPLTDEPWDDERVRASIRRLVERIDVAFDPEGLWPAHEWDAWQAATPLKSLYVGASGVLWALDRLREQGAADTRLDLAAAAEATLAAWREAPDFMRGAELPEPKQSALLTGAAGILLVAWRLTGERALADELHALVDANVDNEAEEVMWGTPGTLVAARHMLDWTGEARWRTACETSADALWARRDERGLWTQSLYGRVFQGLGTAHGLVGNVQALRPSLDDERRLALELGVNALLGETALVEGDLANWPSTPDDDETRLQWCWGAPGVVVAAADYLDVELLLAGTRLTWEAGPHGPEKGFGICHGTAGNGYALLAAFQRTGDEQWLDRARRFAVHALAQAEDGLGRFSLWTGDPGAALFATDCLAGECRYPILG
jgi:lanthionine synthetase-like protein